MASLFENLDNFSGRYSRGRRYDICADGVVVYRDVSEDEVDALVEGMERKPYLYSNIYLKEIK